MRILCPSDELQSIPIRISDRTEGNSGSIGGQAPELAIPESWSSALRYFASVPLGVTPVSLVSIFVSEFESIVEVRGRVNELNLVQVAIHPPTARQVDAANASNLSPHWLEILRETSDWMVDDDGNRVVRPGHKIGGRPHIVRERPHLVRELVAIRDSGFRLVVQFDFPGREDAAISGNWPFGDGMFCLFGKQPFDQGNWRWYWDF
jgi:hypothetical protein